MKSAWLVVAAVLVSLTWQTAAEQGAITVQATPPAITAAAAAPAAAPAKKAEQTKAPAEKRTVEAVEMPAGGITIGGAFGEGTVEGFGDVLAPVLVLKRGLVFVNPRGSMNDSQEEEMNIGLGYRHLVPERKFIVGANAYYDTRWTRYENQFDQFGLGVEFLSEWVDARANAYMAEDGKKLAQQREEVEQWTTHSSSSYWSELYGAGNAILQDYVTVSKSTDWTVRRVYESYEAAMDGWDAEVGVKLPGLEKWPEMRLFVGYQSFENPFGEDLEGLKARVEVRAVPGLTLDAAYYEEEALNAGSEYLVGARVRVPFDLAKVGQKKNPFEGAASAFRPAKDKPFADRMTEQVIRDVAVRTVESQLEENEALRQTHAQTHTSTSRKKHTILDGIAFVDGDNVDDPLENGSYEHPYDHVQEGVNKAALSPEIDITYVMPVTEVDDRYRETVVVREGVTVWGAGTPIYGYGGMSFGGGTYPVVDGESRGPAFTMRSGTTLTGFEIENTFHLVPFLAGALNPMSWAVLVTGDDDPTVYYARRAGIYAYGATDLWIDNVLVSGCS